MPDTDPMPDPETPEWTIAATIKRALQLKPNRKHAYLSGLIAREVVAALRLSKWRITREAADPPYSRPGE